MTIEALSPMLVQYLVGLCCLRWDPDAIEVTIGDMVADAAAGTERDVDVTVTVAESGRITHAFKAYEVKRENAPLDVADAEQLCLKLLDMPSITHRIIVSASGFTAAAETKAAAHGVDLFVLKPWTRPLQEQFPSLTMKGTPEECFPLTKTLLYWIDERLALVAQEGKGDFSVRGDDTLFDSSGAPHRKYPSFAKFRHELLLRSTEILFPLEPAATVYRTFPIEYSAGPAWPHTHTLDVSRDEVYVATASGNCRLDFVTVNGQLQWKRSRDKGLYYVIERTPGGDAFAGALIATGVREGHMNALVFSPKTREVGVHFVRLAEKHLNAIRRLKLDLPHHGTKA